MTQKNDTCPKDDCGKPWITHHSVANVSPDGTLSLHCHELPVPKPVAEAVKYALLARSFKLKAEKELKEIKLKVDEDQQALRAELERKFASSIDAAVDAAIAPKLEQTRLSLSTTHEVLVKDLRRQLTESEQNRTAMASLHEAQVKNLTRQAREANETAEQLATDVTQKSEEIAEAERRSIDLQLQIEERDAKLKLFGRMERALRKRTHEFRSMGIGSFSQSIRIGHLEAIKCRYEKLYGPLPEEPMQDLEVLVASIEGDDEDVEKDDASPPSVPVAPAPKAVVTPPVPPPAPKAVVVTASVAPKAVETDNAVTVVLPPVPPAAPRLVVLDDSSPGSSASADDEDDDQIEDHQVLDQQEAHADDAPSDEDDECRACEKKAKYSYTFIDKKGVKERLVTCDPNAHGPEFLQYLKENAKSAPKSVKDIAILFEEINP
jgi:hypothetical protein